MVVTKIGPAKIANSVSIFSAGRLEAGRLQPAAQVRSGFGLSCLADCGLTNRTRRKQFGLLPQMVCFVGKTLRQDFRLCVGALLLHRAAPFLRGSRERNWAFSSPIGTNRAAR